MENKIINEHNLSSESKQDLISFTKEINEAGYENIIAFSSFAFVSCRSEGAYYIVDRQLHSLKAGKEDLADMVVRYLLAEAVPETVNAMYQDLLGALEKHEMPAG